MKSEIIWLRVSYWVGAMAYFILAILVLNPILMGEEAYCHPMGMMSAAAFSWGCMLIWSDRKPLQRKWILLPTILIAAMLLIAGIYSICVGAVTVKIYFPNFIILPTLIILWSFSYYNTRNIDQEEMLNTNL